MSGMTRRAFVGGAGVAAAQTRRPKPPNVLFIMPDQLRAASVGYMGNRDVQTPNIDKLAAESVVLPNTIANTPVCCPARANILTGRYAHRNGMVANDLRLRESESTLSAAFAEAGYRTGFIGKWHLDGGPRQPGFIPPGPRRRGFEYWAANECSHAHFNTQYFRDTPKPIPVKSFETEAWGALAVDFLRAARNDGRPFFLTVASGPPHDPYKAPPEYAQRYDPAKLTMRPNWKAGERVPGPQQIAQYYGMVSAVDDQVGRLLKALDDNGLRDDTIVLFSSDHGDMLGSQGERLKRKPWEESICVPGLLRYPRKLKPGRHNTFFTHVDFAPTLLGLCGVWVPETMQGTDLSSVLAGGTQAHPDSAFLQIFGPFDGDGTADGWRGVRTERYVYARYESRPWVLYDLQSDPFERRNLVDDPSARTLQEDMERRLAEWMKKTGDSWQYNWHEPVEDGGRLYKQETFFTVDEYLRWAREHKAPAR